MVLMLYDLISSMAPVNEAATTPLTSSSLCFIEPARSSRQITVFVDKREGLRGPSEKR